jgi:hypothetical protein
LPKTSSHSEDPYSCPPIWRIFLESLPRNGIASQSVYANLIKIKTVFQTGCTCSHSYTQWYTKGLSSTQLAHLVSFTHPFICLSDGYKVGASGFYLHFIDYWGAGPSQHERLNHLGFVLWELSIRVHHPAVYWVFYVYPVAWRSLNSLDQCCPKWGFAAYLRTVCKSQHDFLQLLAIKTQDLWQTKQCVSWP